MNKSRRIRHRRNKENDRINPNHRNADHSPPKDRDFKFHVTGYDRHAGAQYGECKQCGHSMSEYNENCLNCGN